MKRIHLSLLVVLSVFFVQCSYLGNKSEEKAAPQVKNVILMIGDGMGVSQVYAGLTANKGTLHLERSHFVGFSKTYSASSYITDSAAGGTAIACGVKTNNGSIGVDTEGNPVKSILEHAADNGLSTGVVSSCAVTHATPASFVAHQSSRKMEEEIAVDILNSGITLFIGGGKKYFDARSDNENLLDKLEAKGFQVALNMDDIKKVTTGKLAGFVADEHPATYPERGEFLPEGVQAAINLLKNNDEGFFLMVEGSQIDWACHANEKDATVNEVLDFDRAIKVAFDYADQNPNTLVIVTADHETGGMALTGGDLSTGEVKAAYASKGHTSVMVPVFAYGARAAEFAGIYQNTDIFSKVLKLYGFGTGK
jgi:alkaline phosphatase